MKILMIHPHDLFDPHEPWTIRIESLAKEFMKMGHEVRVIHFMLDPYIEKYTIHPCGFKTITLQRRGGMTFFRDKFFSVLKEIKWADMVHFQKCFHYVSIPALAGSVLYDKPIHYDWDDNEYAIYKASVHPYSKVMAFFIKTLEEVLPLLVDTVSVASDELKLFALKLGVEKRRIFDAPVGADLNKFGKNTDSEKIRKKYVPSGEPLVAYLGQLNGAQYTDLFIEAVSIIKKAGKKAKFLIIGSGTRFKRLKAYARKLKVNDILTFVGAISHEDVPHYLAASDVAVACFEDNEITRCKSPLKVVEYLASGKAIVASAVGEVRVMLDSCGVLVKPGSSKALADGIISLLDNPKLMAELGIKARKRSEEIYNWPAVAKNLERAYKQAAILHHE